MRSYFLSVAGIVCLCLLQTSCSGPKRPVAKDKVPLTHVTGTIHVDGEPVSGVNIRYVPKGEIAEKREQYVNSFNVQTNESGEFSLKTYARGDGVPEGEYGLFFTLYPQDRAEQIRDGEYDKLGEQYSNRGKPLKVIKVEVGDDVDVGTIELKSVPKRKT